MKKVLIIGATSAIATACARIWSQEATEFFLVGREPEKLQQTADDLIARKAGSASTYALDLNRLDAHPAMIDASFNKLGQIDIILIAHGTLPDQKACEQNVELFMQEITSNGLSVMALLTLLANRMQTQGSGTIAVISSVAGDRGRPSNYVYGTAKAAVTTFCEGLRARLFKSGVHVLTIKPGFVDTPMTKGLTLPRLLVVQPEHVAKDICKAVAKKKDVIYTPMFWWGIMQIIKFIPNFIFKRTSI